MAKEKERGDFVVVEIEQVIPTNQGTIVIFTAEERQFMMTVGGTEGFAIEYAWKKEPCPRPLTAQLLLQVIQGFDAHVSRAVITGIRDNTYIGTLELKENPHDVKGAEGAATERRIWRHDCRPSDMTFLALSTGVPLEVARPVFEAATNAGVPPEIEVLIAQMNMMADAPLADDEGTGDDISSFLDDEEEDPPV